MNSTEEDDVESAIAGLKALKDLTPKGRIELAEILRRIAHRQDDIAIKIAELPSEFHR